MEADGRPVELTAGRLRSLLAVLALSAGQVVPHDRIARAVWHTELPEDVRRSIGTYVARLRAVAGADTIGKGPNGYLLRTGPDQVDALRFLRLTASVRPGAGEEARLREALGLWRGRPFEGVRSPWLVEAYAPRLTESWLAATERRIDLEIGRGHVAGPLAELTDLSGRYPLRESLTLRLMAVLDGTGSPAEALARYEQLRLRLARELGVEPGSELQRAYADLLAGRRIGVAPGPELQRVYADLLAGGRARLGEPATEVPPGRTLPEMAGFVGRAGVLAALDRLILDAPGKQPIAVVHGPAGVGKTALAVHWAQRVRDRFPDGRLYLDLRGFGPSSALSAEEALLRLVESFPAPPAQMPPDLADRVALFRSRLAGRRMLLILDNARDAAQVRPLLPGEPGCAVLVTSRDELSTLVAVAGAGPVALGVLTAGDARSLLGERLGDDRLAGDPAAVEAIVDRCAGLPLALVLVAARAAADPARPLAELSAELRGTAGRLDAFGDLRSMLTWSYRTLGPAAARLFRLLGLWTGPDVTAPVAAALAGAQVRNARLMLAELARASLVTEHRPGRYTMHDLLRAFAAELASENPEPGTAAPITRLLAFHLATARRTVALLAPGDLRRLACDDPWPAEALPLADEAAALRWLDAERPNLVAAVRQAAATPGEPERIAPRIAHALFSYFSVRPHWDDWEEINGLALGAARRLGDRAAEARASCDAGFVAWIRGGFPEARAHYETGLAIYREFGDRRGEAAALAGLGDVHRVLADEAAALAHYETSLAIFREMADLHGQCKSLGSLGILYGKRGRPQDALRCLRESLSIREKNGDRRGMATGLSNLAAFQHRAGRLDEALDHYERSLAMRREQGDRHGQATSLAGIGAVHRSGRRPAEAVRHQRAAVQIFRELADRQCLAENLGALADTVQALGDAAEAARLRDEAGKIFAELGTAEADPAAPAAAGNGR